MNLSKFDELEKICAKEIVAGPAPESAIQAAEKVLGVLFPPSYRLFLMKFGAALGDGFELAGLFEQSNIEEPAYSGETGQ